MGELLPPEFHDLIEELEAELCIAVTAFDANVGIIVTDASGMIERVNATFVKQTGYSIEEVIGNHSRLLKSGCQDEEFYKNMWNSILVSGEWEGEIWDRRKDGDIYPKFLTIRAIKDKAGNIKHYVGTHIDLSESKAAEKFIKNLAFYDPLTQLPNRRLLQDRLQQALVSSKRYHSSGALLFIDLDNFKSINDTLGHLVGDILLQQVARRLEACVREGDTVARFGGDEFVIILEELHHDEIEAAAQAEHICKKILSLLSQPYRLADKESHNTPSIGIAMFSANHSPVINELFKQADIAMYQSKRAGRNTLMFFDPQMQETINAHVELEGQLHQAIELKQFTLAYQLQVNQAGAPVGAEALIRWQHPIRGIISPSQFIQLAEETKLILPIGCWVLETACEQLKCWEVDDLTKNLVISVNVSAKQFHQGDFVQQVSSIIKKHGADPKLLKLELTESMLINNIDSIINTMSQLSDLGVQLSLDDFGTGYSSLQYLKRLPLHQLKIDQSFIHDLAYSDSDKAIVRTIIALAKGLKLDVIAEGVETEDQRKFLIEAGCTHFQGYLFSRPVSIENLKRLLA